MDPGDMPTRPEIKRRRRNCRSIRPAIIGDRRGRNSCEFRVFPDRLPVTVTLLRSTFPVSIRAGDKLLQSHFGNLGNAEVLSRGYDDSAPAAPSRAKETEVVKKREEEKEDRL